MPSKRSAPKPTTNAQPSSGSQPVMNAILIGLAIAFGMYLLVARGRLTWPPTDLMTNAFTVAGCIALVGPIVLFRRDLGEGGVGEMLWMTGGVLVWVYNGAALLRGEASAASLATPIAARTMGLTILAVLVAALRMKGSSRSWSWTNVTGWILGLFWVGVGLASLWPRSSLRVAMF